MAIENEDLPRIIKRKGERRSTSRMRIRAHADDVWNDKNIRLAKGELAYDKTFNSFKLGDGETYWVDLPWLQLNQVLDGSVNSVSVRLDNYITAYRQAETVTNNNFTALTNAVNSANTKVNEIHQQINDYDWVAQYINLTPIENRLNVLESAPAADLTPIENRLTSLENAPAVDLTTVNNRLTSLENAPAVDLTTIENRLTSLENAPAVDLTAIENRLTTLENAQASSVNLTQVNQDIAANAQAIQDLITDLQNGVYNTGSGGGDNPQYDMNYTVGHYTETANLTVVAEGKGLILADFTMPSGRNNAVFRLKLNGGFYIPYSAMRLKTVEGAVLQQYENNTGYSYTIILNANALADGEYVIEVENYKTDLAQVYTVETWFT